MTIASAVIIVAGAVAIAIAAMALARRFAPRGGLYSTSRGIGIYGAAQSGLAILIAFVIFLCFQTYVDARSSAQAEATATLQLYRTAGLFKPPTDARVRAELRCYARAVIGPEWRAMRDGHRSSATDANIDRLDLIVERGTRADAVSASAASAWLDATTERSGARQHRLGPAETFVPPLLWVMLIGGVLTVIGFLMTFADPGERALVQLLIVAVPTAILTSGLVLVAFFATPYTHAAGGIAPVAMQRALTRMDGLDHLHLARGPLPCNGDGVPAA